MSADLQNHEEGVEEISKLEELEAEVPPTERGLRYLIDTARFIRDHNMIHPRYLLMLCRFIKFKLTHRRVVTRGFVFLPRHFEVIVGKGATITIGKWVVIGRNNCIRCHEGSMVIGDKTVFGCDNTINSYLGVHIGEQCLFADSIYIVDFDHNYWDPLMPVRSQGIVMRPVRFEGNTWIGAKSTIVRGVTVGWGSVIGAMSLVNRDIPPFSVVGGVPARVVRQRPVPEEEAWRLEEWERRMSRGPEWM